MNSKYKFVSILSVSLFVCSNICSFADDAVSNPVVGSMVLVYTNGYGVVTQQTETIRQDVTTQEAVTNFAGRWANLLSTAETTGPTPSDKALGKYMLTNRMFSPFTNTAFVAECIGVEGSASDFLLGLKKQGRLPGIASDSHGHGDFSDLIGSDSWMSQKIKYPFLLRFDMVLLGETSTNHYAIMQSSNGSPWKLQRAWRTDSVGRILNEWPVDITEQTQHVK